jgi:hypothetical protein
MAQQILAATPAVLRQLLEGLDERWTSGRYAEDEWSPFDVVGHLVHGEQTDWLPRLHLILEHGTTRPFAPFDRFAQFEESTGSTLAQLLTRFAELRQSNLEHVEALELSQEDWDRQGLHPSLGVVSMRNLLATWVVHDMNHLAQICEALARHYDGAVGPWKQYLPILDRTALGN